MLINAVPKAQLSSLLRRMSQVIPSSSPKEILTKVKLVFREDQLQLHGTDLNQYLKLVAKCSSQEPGLAIVDYNNFRTIISKMSGDTIYITLDNDRVILKDGRSEFELLTCVNVQEFPSQNEIESNGRFSMQVTELVTALESVSHCMDKESTRYALSSVNICGSVDGTLRITATDGRRISMCNMHSVTNESFSLLIPYNVVKAIPNIVDGAKGNCEILYAESWFGLEAEDLTYTCRQSEGRFPALKAFIDQFSEAEYRGIDLQMMRTVASQGMVVSEEEAMGINLEFDGEQLSVTHETQKAKYRATVPSDHGQASITINCQYLHQSLAVCKDMSIAVSNDSIKIKRDDRVFDIIMGMRR